MLEQQTVQLAETDDAQAGQKVVDAFRQGLTDTIQLEAERQAHELGSRESEADLRATIVFLESSAGRAWISTQAQSEADAPKDFYQRIAVAARGHLCHSDCPGPAPKATFPPQGR